MADSIVFDASKSFAENFDLFLKDLEAVDEELTAIVRANAEQLAKVVMDGERDSNARTAFNADIAKALDALVVPPVDSAE